MKKMFLSLIIVFASAQATTGKAQAATIILPQPLFVDSTTESGFTFSYSGNLSTTDSLSFTVTGQACLQGSAYCTNGAGVVVVAGSSGVGGSLTNPANMTTYGSLLLTIGGQTAQVFLLTPANGAGSLSPPTALTFASQPLSALGFNFGTLSDPVIKFSVSDNFRPDNLGGLSLTENGSFQPVAEPATLSIVSVGLLGLLFAMRQGEQKRS